jgi:sirohydrochlorin cobaltochelatase
MTHLRESSVSAPLGAATPRKRAILVPGFGTTHTSTGELSIGSLEQLFATRFPNYEVRRAFTSRTIRRILADRGTPVDDVTQALERLRDEGFEEVLVQPLHLLAGEEYHRVVRALLPHKDSFRRCKLGRPLFGNTDSCVAAVKAIASHLPPFGPGEAVVFMGHGTSHPANAVYALLQLIFDDHEIPAYIGTIDGYPELDHVVRKLRRDGVTKVLLAPLLFAVGDHATNDMAGDEADSWKNTLIAEGFDCTVELVGLGERPALQELYVTAVSEMLSPEESDILHSEHP